MLKIKSGEKVRWFWIAYWSGLFVYDVAMIPAGEVPHLILATIAATFIMFWLMIPSVND